MQGYCKEIEETINSIKNNKDEFNNSYIIRNSIAMDLFQICELVKRLDDDYIKETENEMEWNKIKYKIADKHIAYLLFLFVSV